jgi:hypothetical protein
MRLRIIAGSIAVVGVVAVSIALSAVISGRGTSHPQAPRMIIAQSDQLLPSESLADWSSFADHLALVTITSERKLPPSADEVAANEGYIPRVITLRIDSVLWSRPQAPAKAPAAFDIDLDGWSFHGATLTPLRLEGEPMMTVGKQYVMPIVYLQPSKNVQIAGWSPLSPDSIIPYEAGVLGRGDVLPGNQTTAGTPRAQFDGKSAGDLSTVLGRTAPYPAVAGAMSLPPDERAQLVTR